MNLKNKIAQIQFKGLIKELENLNYNEIIEGCESLKAEYAQLEDDRYFKAMYAITNCMIELQKVYDKKED